MSDNMRDDDKPMRWSRIYTLVAALLALETLAFWLLSRWAS
jgi:hypothetical protein